MTRQEWDKQTKREPGRTAWNVDAIRAAAFRYSNVAELVSIGPVLSGVLPVDVHVRLDSGKYIWLTVIA
jgi:hypothetical protein